MDTLRSSVFICTLSALALSLACSVGEPTTEAVLPVGMRPPAENVDAGSSAPGGPSGGTTSAGAGMGGIASAIGGTASTPAAPAGGLTGGVTTVVEAPCEKKVRTAGKTVPDFMIVLDRSSSMRTTIDASVKCNDPMVMTRPPACGAVDCMNPQWMMTTACGGMMPAVIDRWAPAVSALKSLTMMFQTKVSFGLTIFPGEGAGRGSECTTGTQRVPVGLNTATAIATALDASGPAGYTPTSATLQEVLKQVQAKKTSPDAEVPPQYVLLVTDGSPNCVGPNAANDPMAHQATVAAIDALAKAGVKTYVIGYDASFDPKLAMQLTEYAQHGGTNNFFAVQDGPSLVSKFTEITSVAAECTYTLDMEPADKKYVRVELDKMAIKNDDMNGWSIMGKTVTLNGDACTQLRDGSKVHTLAVTVECKIQEID